MLTDSEATLFKMEHVNVDDEEGVRSRKLGLAPPNINVTPLIDVLLVLLIIFMVIQPQKEAKFESQIPQKPQEDRKSTRLNSSHQIISYAVFCLKKKKKPS